MFIQLSRHWWWLALRGVAAILFGSVALAWRGDSLGSFMLLFGGFALVEGLLAILVVLTNVAGKKRSGVRKNLRPLGLTLHLFLEPPPFGDVAERDDHR